MALSDYTSFEFIQQDLFFQFTNFRPHDTQDILGFLDLVASPENMAARGLAIQDTMTGSDGKINKLKLIFDQRFITADITDSSIQDCDGGAVDPEDTFELDIDPDGGKSREGTVNNSDLIRSKDGAPARLTRQIQKAMDGIEREIDVDIITTASTNFGIFPSSGTAAAIAVKTLKADGETFTQQFISGVKNEFRRMNFQNTVWLVGQGLSADWFDQLPPSPQDSGDFLPVQLARRDMRFMYDANVEGVIGADNFIAFAPGAAQFVQWNEFEGPGNVLNDDTYTQGTLMNPRSGMVYDFLIKFDCNKWNYQVKLAYELFFLPNDLMKVGDPLRGVNWFQRFAVIN